MIEVDDEQNRKVIWTDGYEQNVYIDHLYLDDPTGEKGKIIVVHLDAEDYEKQFDAEEARALAVALLKAADEIDPPAPRDVHEDLYQAEEAVRRSLEGK